MAQYRVYAGETLIGHSALESGDPPMGVASGKFFALPAYAFIQPQFIASRDLPQSHLALTIVRPNGDLIPSEHGVTILDYSAELGEIEVHVVGIGYPLYEELFPNLAAAYRLLHGGAA